MTLSAVEQNSERDEALEWPPASCPHFVARWREADLPFRKHGSPLTGASWARLGCLLTGARWDRLETVSREMEVTPAEFLLGAWRGVLARVRGGKGETCDLSLSFQEFVASVADGTCKVSLPSDEPTSLFEFYLQEGEPGSADPDLQEEDEGCTVRLLAFQNTTHLELLLLYQPGLFERPDMQRLFDAFDLFLEAALAAPSTPIDQINFVSESEAKRLLVNFNETQTAFPKEKCLQTLLEEQAQRYSSVTAVLWGEQSLSYRELNRRAEAVAQELLRRGVTLEVPVPLVVEPSAHGLAGFFGILKAGGVCVPVEPGHATNSAEVAESWGSSPVLVTTSRWTSQVAAFKGKAVLVDCLPSAAEADVPGNSGGMADERKAGGEPGLAAPGARPCHGAVILQGSGANSGRVLLTHRNLVNAGCGRVLAYGEHVRTCLLEAQLGWGELLGGMLWTFLQGGTVVLAGGPGETADLIASLERDGPSHLVLRAETFETLVAEVADRAFESVRGIVLVSPLRQPVNLTTSAFPSAQLWSEWGTPESTYCSCFSRIVPPEDGAGSFAVRPFPNTELYVLDPHEKLLPIWATGEVYVGGECVARAFEGDAAGPSSRFISNPFGRPSAERLYASGARGRWRPDGTLELQAPPDHSVAPPM